ncbi:L,D-transpeptidase [Nakamurella endophytica]|uniref:L,D-transpeptidase 2 n=1 Tax=Nakamurella endophytica TaxID=1748367 RepID=A0A917TD89_9ACTN|nr:Ig-like domain-containing protein [Nakamurella endophytica]GGM18635.1 L,D-transpeptidase 2 [Nakamurella endophytica]
MPTTPSRIARLMIGLITTTMTAAACSAVPTATTVTTTTTIAATAEPATPTVRSDTAATGSTSTADTRTAGTGTTSTGTAELPTPAAPTTSGSPTQVGPKIDTVPADGTTGISPIAPVVITARGGTLRSVSLTNPDGRLVQGSYSADERRWTSTEPLGYNRRYTIEASATGAGPARTDTTAVFTTVKPAQTVYPSFFPNPQMKTVGIGQPIVVIFDKAPRNKVTAEKALQVSTVPTVKGNWYWWDERTLHYRPQHYWTPGTKITVRAKVYGVNFGGGMYGETDRTLHLTIGPSKIAKIDDATKQMEVFIAGKKVRTIPVSMGRNQKITVAGKNISFVTPSGTYVAQEKYAVKRMSSATYGLPTSYDLGYDQDIPLAVTISGEGIVVHSAPWSVADQGRRNVSHGCININPQAAQWFYNTFSYGDIVTVTGTSTKLEPTDGFGDWNIPWHQWQQGSALP